MSKIPVGLLSRAVLMLVWVGSSWSQDSTDKPLGDAAREQHDLHKQAKGQKIYDNRAVAPPSSSDNPESTSSKSAGASPDAPKPADPAAKTSLPTAGKTEGAKAEVGVTVSPMALDRPKTDRPKDSAAEKADGLLIVPEGTQLTIDISGAKVVVPVRVGFATAIPALSMATVRLFLRGTAADSGAIAELTDVTVEGVRYNVVTGQVPVPGPSAVPSEVRFTLLKEISIAR